MRASMPQHCWLLLAPWASFQRLREETTYQAAGVGRNTKACGRQIIRYLYHSPLSGLDSCPRCKAFLLRFKICTVLSKWKGRVDESPKPHCERVTVVTAICVL